MLYVNPKAAEMMNRRKASCACAVLSLQALHAEVSQKLVEATELAQPKELHSTAKRGKHSNLAANRMFLSIDFEWWEKSDGVILEIGWSLWDTFTCKHRSRHWVIKENLNKVDLVKHTDLIVLTVQQFGGCCCRSSVQTCCCSSGKSCCNNCNVDHLQIKLPLTSVLNMAQSNAF